MNTPYPPAIPLPTHGIIDIPWDHASLPETFWKHVKRQPNGCWTAKWEEATGWRAMVVLRLLEVNPKTDAWYIVPTCGDFHCCNPAHICVTLRTPNSRREMKPGMKSK